MKFAQACIVDISDQNPDMFVELGRIHGARKDGCPLIIVLERGECIKIRLSIEIDIIHISYPVVTGLHAVGDLAKDLKTKFDNGVIERLNATKEHHYLSHLMFKGVTSDVAIALSRKYKTMEAFTSAKPKDISQYLRSKLGPNLNLNAETIAGYKKHVSDVLKDL